RSPTTVGCVGSASATPMATGSRCAGGPKRLKNRPALRTLGGLGAFRHWRAGKVDLLYRNADQVARTIEEVWAGVYHHDYDQQPTCGFCNTNYPGEIQICIPLFDPEGLIARLKARVEAYPPPLRHRVVAQELWNAEFALAFAEAHAAAGDVYNTAGCMARVAGSLNPSPLRVERDVLLGG